MKGLSPHSHPLIWNPEGQRAFPVKYLSADVGGTFTDLVMIDGDSGALMIDKLRSTAGSAAAITAGIRRIAAAANIEPADIDVFIHGFTIATNALLTRTGARTVLVVTEGFRDLLEIGDQRRAELYSLTASKPPPLVPRSRVVEVAERIDSFGDIVQPLSHPEIERTVAAIAGLRPEVVAVSLIFGHIAPEHERRLGAAIAAALPDVPVYLACDINRQIEEYPRALTTGVAAYVGPEVRRYVDELEAGLVTLGMTAPLLLMRSDGGVATPPATRENPAQMLLSGPAGGVIAGAELGRALGIEDFVTFDMGGTSADFSLIIGGEPRTVPTRTVAGEPLRLPSLDIETISAGGGSLARVDVGGGLKVGPASAGADPGPACYARGGTQATVTDAMAVLGILGADERLGGEMPIDPGLAAAAIRANVAEPLGLSVEAAAIGIVSVSSAQMVEAIRTLSISRGCDIRRFSLMACGGAGPIFAGFMARELSMPEVLVPLRPGVFAAAGLLMCDFRHHAVRPYPVALSQVDPEALRAQIADMTGELDEALARDGVAASDREFRFAGDMRCVGQFHELAIHLAQFEAAADWHPETIAQVFHEAHDKAYGHSDTGIAVEFVNLRAEGIGRRSKARFPVAGEHRSDEPVPVARRPVYLDRRSGFVDCPVYRRSELGPGHRLVGPAIVVQRDTTVLIQNGLRGEIDELGVIHVRTGGEP